MGKAITKFSPEVVKKLQYYVYRLVDPENNETFYIGKGKGNRIFQHVKDARKDENDSFKIEIIKRIQEDGKKVIQVVHRWGLCETTAFELEAALIDAYEPFTNIASGRRSDVSPLTVEEIQKTLEIKETAKFEYKHKILIIKITQDSIEKREGIYEAACEAWKIDPEKANKADYILAVCSGVIKGVYVLTGKWHKSSLDASRYKFEGKPAPDDIQELYKGKLIPQEYREKSAANPIRYSWKTGSKSSKRGKK